MKRLLVFNPEHDYALAQRGHNYTPPASVRRLGDELKLLPVLWSADEDCILLPDNSFFDCSSGEVVPDVDVGSIEMVLPWGWDSLLLHRLELLGISPQLLPSRVEIETIRALSHRRTALECNIFLGVPNPPIEFFDVDEALGFYDSHGFCYFKMPWSSGGRGVISTLEPEREQVAQWLSGAIRRQGSVMGEIGVDRALDFATLWDTGHGGRVDFLGVSVSLSDGRGKYDGNLSGSQENLQGLIQSKAPCFGCEIIEKQKAFIEKEIAPHYAGLLGIDMMADKEGNLYPCVEINLRRTMGHVAMQYWNLTEEQRNRVSIPSLPLKLWN